MYNLLKTICDENNYGFTYARKDFQNLFDLEPVPNKPYVFLDPIKTTQVFGDYNSVESSQFDGSFMILLSSDIDDGDYDYRYQTYIKPLLNGAIFEIKKSFTCNGKLTINSWSEVEVIDALDWNGDGVIVTYSIDSTL